MKRVDYQNPNDDLEEITDRSNAEVRAWGKKILADADELLVRNQTDSVNYYEQPVSIVEESDWDQVPAEPVEPDLEVSVEETESEPEPTPVEETVTPAPKTAPKAKGKPSTTS